MSRVRLALLLALVTAACHDDIAGPVGPAGPAAPARAVGSASADQGPPPPHQFGPDSYRLGVFTGQGTTKPGLKCEKTTKSVRECTGFLASGVDGTLLDVTLSVPLDAPKPMPLVALIHGYAGSKTSSGDLVPPLLAEGYAVLRYSTRGFGESWGQVNMVDVHAEVA